MNNRKCVLVKQLALGLEMSAHEIHSDWEIYPNRIGKEGNADLRGKQVLMELIDEVRCSDGSCEGELEMGEYSFGNPDQKGPV